MMQQLNFEERGIKIEWKVETTTDFAFVKRTIVRGKHKKIYPNFYIGKSGKISFRKTRKNQSKFPEFEGRALMKAISDSIKEEIDKEILIKQK
jgi:hypothetical protein